ncbi:Uncharacterised protein [Mycobacteroides abscessus]|nr:Uncharacterised protein [Mycobacteroides abscessus]
MVSYAEPRPSVRARCTCASPATYAVLRASEPRSLALVGWPGSLDERISGWFARRSANPRSIQVNQSCPAGANGVASDA